MTETAIFEGLRAVVREVVGLDLADGQFHGRRLDWRDLLLVDDLELDALSRLDLLLAVEERFGINLDAAEFHGLRTLGAVAEIIPAALARRAP